ncbi:MAG: hypothetical protein KKA67_15250 [Spirochaetes bacterium]|nr:hypothetical protein [Spirochaetota bacterium]MBU1081888.1 hypothetical protein [Spirochaetota bacterium]
MIILPGLTSTKKERMPAFIDDLRRSDIRRIALFPTCLSAAERRELYSELESIAGLRIPHVHLRSDCGADEIAYLADRFGAEAFNIHPRASSHPFGPVPARYAQRIFVENVDEPAEDAELDGDGGPAIGGMCPDFSHLENARICGRTAYVETVTAQLRRYPVGCCHLSAIRIGVPNQWSGTWDHHEFSTLADLDYLAAYAGFLPRDWASLELENGLPEQLEARDYLERLFSA